MTYFICSYFVTYSLFININMMIIIVVTDFEQNFLRERDSGGWAV